MLCSVYDHHVSVTCKTHVTLSAQIMLYFFPDQEIDAAKIIDKLRYMINTIYSTKAKALKIRKCVLRTVQILYVLGVLYMNYTIRFSGPFY